MTRGGLVQLDFALPAEDAPSGRLPAADGPPPVSGRHVRTDSRPAGHRGGMDREVS
ncbi:hypothetical protein ACFQXA_33445 [Nocardiopsis composta]